MRRDSSALSLKLSITRNALELPILVSRFGGKAGSKIQAIALFVLAMKRLAVIRQQERRIVLSKTRRNDIVGEQIKFCDFKLSEALSSEIPRSHSGRIKRSNYVNKRRFKLGRVRK